MRRQSIHGQAHTRVDRRSSSRCNSIASTAGTSPKAPIRRDSRVRAISPLTSVALSGGSSSAMSSICLNAGPPAPKAITAPNTGSVCRPRQAVRDGARPIAALTVAPDDNAPARDSCLNPMPKAASSARASVSLSSTRPAATATSRIARAVSICAIAFGSLASGTCRSVRWLRANWRSSDSASIAFSALRKCGTPSASRRFCPAATEAPPTIATVTGLACDDDAA